MKLVIREYLASLRERNELDAILPDLLSQLGLSVLSKPTIGTRQDGVDVAAVGSLDARPEAVYLFSIKAGDLTRQDWDDNSMQSLRRSLNEILDSYIPNRLPIEHKSKKIVICPCFGGTVQEAVRGQLSGFEKTNSNSRVSFEEWHGEKLAALIEANFLREELLPPDTHSLMRKALALLDEPDVSHKHFSKLIHLLSKLQTKSDKELLFRFRQINLCLWILFSWARKEGNLESPYLSSEIALLSSWELHKTVAGTTKKTRENVTKAFGAILSTYHQICFSYLEKNILPHTRKLHGLSNAVHSTQWLDVNQKLFEVLGRLSLACIWLHWLCQEVVTSQDDIRNGFESQMSKYISSIDELIANNPALFLPARDDHVVEIALTFLALRFAGACKLISFWLREMIGRAQFAYATNGIYPTTIKDYAELLDHPAQVENYLQKSTPGSELFPFIALCSTLIEDEELFSAVRTLKNTHLAHCDFQYWYPDESSEENIYQNWTSHGYELSPISMEQSSSELTDEMLGECDHSTGFQELSAVRARYWPVILVACRYYRLPVPLHFFR